MGFARRQIGHASNILTLIIPSNGTKTNFKHEKDFLLLQQ
jgi:hypothetical protein